MEAAERRTLYGNASLVKYVTSFSHLRIAPAYIAQRESSATIKAPPIAYQQTSPPTRQKIIEFDCRGLEFTEFKPEVTQP